jgi:streptogramin lyase
MKNITLSADEQTIEAARAKARAEHSSLNEEFRRWLAEYAGQSNRLEPYDAVIEQLRGRLAVGRKLSREEMNER